MALLPQTQPGLLPQRRAQLLPLDMGASVRAEAEGHQQRFGAPQGGYIPFPTMPTWQQVMQYAKEHPLDALAGVTAPIPLLGDATGLLADSVEMAQNPSATNAMLLGIGAATVAPSGAAGRMADALFGAGKDAAGTVKRVVGEAGDVAKALPTDEASRMADDYKRSFNVDAYHGTGANISEFTRNGVGSGSREGPLGVWFTDNPQAASQFADFSSRGEGGNVIPAKLKLQNPLEVSSYDEIKDLVDGFTDFQKPGYEIGGRQVRMKGDKVDYDGLRKSLEGKGYDGIVLRSTMVDSPDGKTPINQYIVFDPKNVRSRHAKFDPAKKNSADLLAGIGAGGLLGFGAYNRLSTEEEY